MVQIALVFFPASTKANNKVSSEGLAMRSYVASKRVCLLFLSCDWLSALELKSTHTDAMMLVTSLCLSTLHVGVGRPISVPRSLPSVYHAWCHLQPPTGLNRCFHCHGYDCGVDSAASLLLVLTGVMNVRVPTRCSRASMRP
jgi:hypothetical protein